jgi:hypothetical protein
MSLSLFITIDSSKRNNHNTVVLAFLYRVTTVRSIATTTCELVGLEDHLDKTKAKLSLRLSTTLGKREGKALRILVLDTT